MGWGHRMQEKKDNLKGVWHENSHESDEALLDERWWTTGRRNGLKKAGQRPGLMGWASACYGDWSTKGRKMPRKITPDREAGRRGKKNSR